MKQTQKQIRETFYKAIKCELEIIEGRYKQNVLGSSYDYVIHRQVYNHDENEIVDRLKIAMELLDKVENYNRKGTNK